MNQTTLLLLTVFALVLSVLVLLRARDRGWSDAFGCLTRVEMYARLRWPRLFPVATAFLDVDHMHEWNEALGYDRVDQMIREALSVVGRRAVVGQLKSGDEFGLVAAPGTVLSLALAVRAALAATQFTDAERAKMADYELTAPGMTVVVCERTRRPWATLGQLGGLCGRMKATGRRGGLVVLPGPEAPRRTLVRLDVIDGPMEA
jgi:hypothetical protein